jgi:hypothetical protein
VNLSYLGLFNSNIEREPSEDPATKYVDDALVHKYLMQALAWLYTVTSNSGGC